MRKAQAEAGKVASELQRHGVDAAAFQCDVTQPADIARMVDAVVARFGRLDILINDAAYNKSIPFSDLDGLTDRGVDEDHRRQPHRPDACHQGGGAGDEEAGARPDREYRFDCGTYPGGSSIAYAVSKAGLIHLTRCMSVALAPEVLVNCVAPGLLEGTRATANLSNAHIERSASGSLLKRAADKDDCADQVVTMCRTETMTGQTVAIDSGRVFH